MRLVVLVVTLSLFMLSACATIPTGDIKIDADADKKVNFSGYKNYSWFAAAGILRDPEGKWEPPGFDADAEIKLLVDRELRKRGMTETSANPDFLVAYVVGIDMTALKLKENPDTQLTTLENIPKGGLILLLVDPQTASAIWAAVATAELNEEMDIETRKKRLDYAVTKMIKQLPK